MTMQGPGAADGRSAAAAAALLAALAGEGPIEAPLLVVVAHPDDETLMLGGQLSRLRDALLLHLTDGAPRDGVDARRCGFASPAAYAGARRRELAAALRAGEAGGVRTARLQLRDKEAWCHLPATARRVAGWVRRQQAAAVLTHAYEGGHPDHDAAAFAVHAACRLLPDAERPAVIETPLYRAGDGGAAVRGFLPGPEGAVSVRLADDARRRKARMAACFETQRDVIAGIGLDPEYFRPAPAYDFRQPPHAGGLLYESFGWDIGGAEWRRRAAAALQALGLD